MRIYDPTIMYTQAELGAYVDKAFMFGMLAGIITTVCLLTPHFYWAYQDYKAKKEARKNEHQIN